jgi:hypothetical protein
LTLPQVERSDPFETPELVRMRWDQRRRLRFFDDDLVRRAGEVSFDCHLDPDRARLREDELRTEAERILEEIEAPLVVLEGWRRAEEAFLLLQEVKTPARSPWFDRPIGELRIEYERRTRDGPGLGDIDPVHGAPFVKCASLLMLADLLAEDGYRDPRAPRAEGGPA